MTSQSRATVALVAHGIHDHGGMERAFSELIKRAHDRYEFVVIASELAEDLRPLVRWERVVVPMRPVSLKTPSFFVRAGFKLAGERVDLVHTLGAIVPNRVDIATVHFCHAGHRQSTGALAPRGAPPLRRLNTTIARRVGLAAERWCYRTSRLGVLGAVSPGVAAEIRRHYPDLRVVLTPNGVEVERFRPDRKARARFRARHCIGDDEVVALFVGGDWQHKGVDVAIDAIARADGTGRDSLRLWVVGRGDARRFSALAQARGVANRVTFFGPQADTERFYQAADLFVIPTLYETFSLVAHEAASCALPVVATRVSGIEDLLQADSAGLVVDRTSESVAAAIARLASDPVLRRRMGEAGRARVAVLDWQRSVDSVVSLYAEILARRGGAAVSSRPSVPVANQ